MFLLQATGGLEVDHQEHAAVPQAAADLGEHLGGPGLVVDGIESGDQIELAGSVQRGDVPADDVGGGQSQPSGLGPCGLQRLG